MRGGRHLQLLGSNQGIYMFFSTAACCRLQVNSEHMLREHASLHRTVDVFLCKTLVCYALMRQYIRTEALSAAVWYMGHSSLDPTVVIQPAGAGDSRWRPWKSWGGKPAAKSAGAAAAPSPGTQRLAAFMQHRHPSLLANDGPDFTQFIHVKGAYACAAAASSASLSGSACTATSAAPHVRYLISPTAL